MSGLTRLRADLWETRGESPFLGLTTHAYLWMPQSGGNVLFYSTVTDQDFDEIAELGGIGRQYLSHHDEAGPILPHVKHRFGASLHAPRADARRISGAAEVDAWLDRRHIDDYGIEVIPTPGHTPGSTCYLVPGAGGERYLFTGDTLFVNRDGSWAAGNLPFSDAAALAASLELLAPLHPTLVVSSAAPSGVGAHPMRSRDEWLGVVADALGGLKP